MNEDQRVEDRVELRGLRVHAIHGVNEAERHAAQPFEIDIDLVLQTSDASRSDDLQDTADYSAAADIAMRVMASPPHRLLESLAAEIAEDLLSDRHVRSVTVGIRKLRPPVAYDVGSTGVRVTRSRRNST
jgi:7,8-dihydroneopterin aldolase/epimerase/oxygenase